MWSVADKMAEIKQRYHIFDNVHNIFQKKSQWTGVGQCCRYLAVRIAYDQNVGQPLRFITQAFL